jgi:hypothetical protein
VLPGIYPKPLIEFSAKARERELYWTFVFEDDLHEKSVVQTVGHEPIPLRCREFPLFRAGLRDPKTGQVKTWWLWDGKKEWPIGALGAEHKHLPIRQIWNYKILADRIAAGWNPTTEV